MEQHQYLSDKEFEEQFETCQMNPSIFSHEAHLRLGWIHVKKYGELKASENVCKQILKFDQRHGDGNKFHKTLTMASVKVVNHFYQKSTSETFQDFMTEFPRLKTNFKDLIDQHYGFDIYNSLEARKTYLAPDLLAFS